MSETDSSQRSSRLLESVTIRRAPKTRSLGGGYTAVLTTRKPAYKTSTRVPQYHINTRARRQGPCDRRAAADEHWPKFLPVAKLQSTYKNATSRQLAACKTLASSKEGVRVILPFPAKHRSPSGGPPSVARARHSPEVFLMPGLLSPVPYAKRFASRAENAVVQPCFTRASGLHHNQ